MSVYLNLFGMHPLVLMLGNGNVRESTVIYIRYAEKAFRMRMISFEASIVCYTTRLSNTGYLVLVLGSEPTCLTIIVDQMTS
jgi:hypothetical protein